MENPGNLWVPVSYVDYNQIRKWISTISTDEDFYRSGYYYAANILDHNDQKVGVWFSYETFAPVKFLEGNNILVYTPDLNQNFSLLSGVD